MAHPEELSRREREVVELLLKGQSNKQMALALGISERTVEFHLKNIYDKLGVSSRVELVLKLGTSTVAGAANVADNGGRLSQMGWADSLRDALFSISKELRMTTLSGSEVRSAGSTITFFEAIRICLTKYAEFGGRATRPEFWWFALFVTLVVAALVSVSETLGSVFLIAMLLPLLAAGTRRLRDSGKSGWWQLFLLAPVGGIVILSVLWALPPSNPLPDDTVPA